MLTSRCQIICLMAFLLALALPVRAQSIDVATAEQVAIAFYKTAGLRPNFASWARDTDEYRHTPVARRERVEAQIAGRLSESYTRYSPESDLLNVATMAIVSLSEEPDPDNITRVNHFILWHFISENSDFFPYEYRDAVFALAPLGIKDFQRAAITPEQYTYLRERMGNTRRFKILLHMRAQQADGTAPVKIFGEDVWALRTLMAGVSLWNADGSMLWERSAGWYVSPQTQTLNDLKQERDGVEGE